MIEFFGVINLALAALLLLWPLWYSRNYIGLPTLNPMTIVMVVYMPVQLMKLYIGPFFLIEDGLFDAGYQFALAMGNVYSMSQLIGAVLFFKFFKALRIDRYIPLKNYILAPQFLMRASWGFFLMYLLSLNLLASENYGIIDWILNPREGYQSYRTGQGHWYAMAISSFAAFCVLSVLARPTAATIFLRAPFFFAMGYLLGTKGMLLQIFIFLATFLWFVKWQYFWVAFVLGMLLVFGLALFNLYLALADNFDIQAIVQYFDYYKNAADYYSAYLADKVSLYTGEILLSSFWSYVPRVLWPEKPFVYGVTIINEIFFPGQAERTNTPAFGGAVEQFSDFGLMGVVAFGILGSFPVITAIFSYLIYCRPGIDLKNISLASLVLMLVQFSPGFGTFLPGPLYIVAIAIFITAILMNSAIIRFIKASIKR